MPTTYRGDDPLLEMTPVPTPVPGSDDPDQLDLFDQDANMVDDTERNANG